MKYLGYFLIIILVFVSMVSTSILIAIKKDLPKWSKLNEQTGCVFGVTDLADRFAKSKLGTIEPKLQEDLFGEAINKCENIYSNNDKL